MTTAKPLPTLKSDAETPLYHQLKLWLVERIRAGEWEDGALPSERYLSETLEISRATVRQAINLLERDGWVDKRHGRGTFVAHTKVEQSLNRVSGFSENMTQAGRVPSSKLLSAELQEPSDKVRGLLGLSPGVVAGVITRLRLADGVALMLERSHLPHNLTPGLLNHDLGGSLYKLLSETYRLTLARGEESLEVRAADAEVAKHLGLRRGEPLLYTQRVVKDERGTPVEYAERFARADRCKFRVQLTGNEADFALKE